MSRVTFPTPSASASGDLFLPPGDAKAPVVLVVPEWWGLNDGMRAMAERFAGEGFAALALDLYHGKVTRDASEAARLSSELETERFLDDVRGALSFMQAHPRSSGKIGITGFCLGGALAVAAAFQVDGLSAAVPFYGNPRADLVDYSRPTPPIQGHYAARDHFADPKREREIADGVRSAGRRYELHVYDAGHAFMRVGDPAAYHEASAELAWSRTIAFLRAELTS